MKGPFRPCNKKTARELFLSKKLYKHSLFPAAGTMFFLLVRKMAECLDVWVPALSRLTEVSLSAKHTPLSSISQRSPQSDHLFVTKTRTHEGPVPLKHRTFLS